MDQLLMVAAGIASSFLLGAFKKVTGALDTAIGTAIKPLQPVLILGLTIALPMLGAALHLADVPSATVIATAPASTLLAIVLREIARRLKDHFAPVGDKSVPIGG